MKTAIITVAALLALTITACLSNPDSNEVFDTPAAQLVREIKLGWNLGNAFDVNNNFERDNPSVAQMETGWENPVTTLENITAIRNAGFNAIRIPVTWHKAVDRQYTVRQDWMARVTEVVDYAAANDMYIILNTHHDKELFSLLNSGVNASLAAFRRIWEQIADNFKDYDEKLIFEALNELTTEGSENEWTGGTARERANLNKYYQVFVDVVRASGGNNGTRFLMVAPIGAKSSRTAFKGFTLPHDPEPDRLIVSIHSYAPENFAFPIDEMPWASAAAWSKHKKSDTLPITAPIDLAYQTFVSKGIPVIIGEFGAGNKDNTAARAEWAEFYVGYAKSKGMPCFLWDMGQKAQSAIINRSNNTFYFPEYIHALFRGAGIYDMPSLPVSDTPAFTLVNPNGGRWSYSYTDTLLFGGGKIEQGSVYTFAYSFTSNTAIEDLQVGFVDCTTATNWAWRELSPQMTIVDNVEAHTVYSGEIHLKAAGTATNTAPQSNRMVFTAGTGTTSAPTLRFTAFELTKSN